MAKDELLQRDASYEYFDSQIYDGSVGLKDLDLDAVAWLRDCANRDPNRTYPKDPETFLRELSLLRDDGITNAAVLLFGKRHVAVALKTSGIVDFRLMYTAFADYDIIYGRDDREFRDDNQGATDVNVGDGNAEITAQVRGSSADVA